MYLYHYYQAGTSPFRNLSELTDKEAQRVMERIRRDKPDSMCAGRQLEYMELRRYYENILREEFRKKGGRIRREVPHYMVVEACPWLAAWYEPSSYVRIPVEEFDRSTLSFTYGDSHPTFSAKVNDGKEYRRKLYTYEEILGIIERYGLPQDWNGDGKYGPERYIEVHVWSDETIDRYRQ